MTRPTKKHDGKKITIVACENCLDEGTILTGVYHHIEKKQCFGFDPDGRRKNPMNRHCCLLLRDEWKIVEP